jgi:hypothetical protein
MFLLAEAILLGLDNITDGLVVYPKRIEARVQEELPFMITETVCLFGPFCCFSLSEFHSFWPWFSFQETWS